MHGSLYGTWCEIKQIEFRQRFDPTYQYRQPLPEDLEKNTHLKMEHLEDQTASDYLDFSGHLPAEANDAGGPAVEGKFLEWRVWECEVCGFIYDEELGLPEEGIEPGTRWDDIPEEWCCPDCGVTKAEFSMIERQRVA